MINYASNLSAITFVLVHLARGGSIGAVMESLVCYGSLQ